MENSQNLVAIVGRPNVGKSCLFNRLIGHRHTIVEPSQGVTRDRVYAQVIWGQDEFLLVDTGGVDFEAGSDLSAAIIKQAKKAIEEASLILFVVDANCGIVPADREVAEYVRRFDKKVIVVVNKVDSMENIDMQREFYELGFDSVHYVSALHGLSIDDLLDDVLKEMPSSKRSEAASEEAEGLKIAIVGRPNVGKSSFVNQLLKEERVIVDNTPGTTRDSIDTSFEFNGQKVTLIDTAGIRRKGKTHTSIDVYSLSRTVKAVKRADVCIVLLDAREPLSRDDLNVFRLINETEKCCVIGINKCDLAKVNVNNSMQMIAQKLSFVHFAFVAACSAKTGKNVDLIFKLVRQAWENAHKKIKQNKLVAMAKELTSLVPTSIGPLKINYLTQLEYVPPAFVMIVNRPELVKDSFLRYADKYIRQQCDFQGVPLKIMIRKKK
ncbi:MAG: ribosome biogenesis GTPase Der [Candidatus Omnitrophica bacterium]|nr:ribosome biogenesis GTPase Der [Candidatus Omnitrophota bacterium]MBU4478147.1 ribosome biogenesis GTPase Der [Candidatus Omnitrophota bacterium]MCG2704056.1 ribosome biogenesis GTPase Der [Candidatus Omnitrophota bacterium]